MRCRLGVSVASVTMPSCLWGGCIPQYVIKAPICIMVLTRKPREPNRVSLWKQASSHPDVLLRAAVALWTPTTGRDWAEYSVTVIVVVVVVVVVAAVAVAVVGAVVVVVVVV